MNYLWRIIFLCAASGILNAHVQANDKNPMRTIRSITIDNQDIFNLDHPDESGWIYQAANALHAKTKKATITGQLLFKVGDNYNPRLLEESERILRNNRYLRDASITAKETGTFVDINVETNDTWSTKPSISFDKKADTSRTKLGLEEDNLLGFGLGLGIEYSKDTERTESKIYFSNKNFRSSWYQLGFSYSLNSDGNEKSFQFEKPFYELTSTKAAGVTFYELSQINSIYDKNGKIYAYETYSKAENVYIGWSKGLQNKHTLRHQLGFRSQRRQFFNIPEREWNLYPTNPYLPSNYPLNHQILPENTSEYYPYYQVDFLQDAFIKTSNFEKIGRTEDRYIGTRAALGIGYASESFGSEGNAVKINIDLGDSYFFNEANSIVADLKLRFDADSTKLTNLYFNASLKYFLQQSRKWQLYGDIVFASTHNLDYRQQLFLGGTNGLRGYSEHFLSGSATQKITVEQRYFSDLNPWRIFNLGGAVFFDAGRSSGDNDIDKVKDKIYSDVGLGLRLASNRSSQGNIIHLDIAFPLNKTESKDSYQITLTTKKTF